MQQQYYIVLLKEGYEWKKRAYLECGTIWDATAFRNDRAGQLQLDKVKGGLKCMTNWAIRHLLGNSCNLKLVVSDQLKMLNVLEIWNDLHN